MRGLIVLAAAVALLAGGCSSGSSLPAEETIEVAFDGRKCSIVGPSSLPSGTVVSVVLTNESDVEVFATLARQYPHWETGEERAYEEFVAMQRAAGGVLRTNPDDPADWPEQWLREEPPSFAVERMAVATALADNQHLRVYHLANEIGDDVVYVSTDRRIGPEAIWFCGSVAVR